uniref:Predicted protein n=1 Tax=Physcomitrium patens TaxID=3218 RepID=A9U3J9_PHYPA
MVIKNENLTTKRIKQSKERIERSQAKNLLRNEQDRKLKKKHRQSWIKPWLHACLHIRSYQEDDRSLIFQKYIPLKKLPRALARSVANSPANLSKPLMENEEGTEELGIPLAIFSIGNTSDPDKTGSEDRHKSLANKDQFRVYQNLWFSPHIQPRMQTSQPVEDKGPVQQDSPIHRVEVVNAVLTRSQQKDKNLIEDMAELSAREQVAPSTGLNEPISVLKRIPILKPQQTEEPNSSRRANLP